MATNRTTMTGRNVMTSLTAAPARIVNDCLYITIQYLRTVGKQNKYHWGLFISGTSPPKGYLLHATDAGRKALDLYQETRAVSNPIKSGTMVVVLKIANSPGFDVLKWCAANIHLMDLEYLPRGEDRWTCRVWVKEVLKSLHKNRYIQLPSDVDTIEQQCQYTADANLQHMGKARIFNDLDWMTSGSSMRATLSDADARRGSGSRHYGTSPMTIDSTSGTYYGSSPMTIDSTSSPYYGSSPMVIDSTSSYRTGSRYYGPSPMDTRY